MEIKDKPTAQVRERGMMRLKNSTDGTYAFISKDHIAAAVFDSATPTACTLHLDLTVGQGVNQFPATIEVDAADLQALWDYMEASYTVELTGSATPP